MTWEAYLLINQLQERGYVVNAEFSPREDGGTYWRVYATKLRRRP